MKDIKFPFCRVEKNSSWVTTESTHRTARLILIQYADITIGCKNSLTSLRNAATTEVDLLFIHVLWIYGTLKPSEVRYLRDFHLLLSVPAWLQLVLWPILRTDKSHSTTSQPTNKPTNEGPNQGNSNFKGSF